MMKISILDYFMYFFELIRISSCYLSLYIYLILCIIEFNNDDVCFADCATIHTIL